MIVIILEKVPLSLRGELSRWLIQPKSGVFVGNVSALVRDKLWALVLTELRAHSGAIMIHNAPTEEGYNILIHGDTSRSLVKLDGLQLIRTWFPNPQAANKKMNACLKNFRISQEAKEAGMEDVQV